MKPVNFFIEGKGDRKFLIDLIHPQFSAHLNEEIFFVIGGNTYELLSKGKNFFIDNIEKEITNLVIFDADNNNFEETKTNLLKWKSELRIEFELFLFPNNKSEGNLESLLENIILPQHKIILDCFDEYQNCLNRSAGSYSLPNQKAKIYAYTEALTSKTKSESLREEKRNYLNSELWDLNSEYLAPLKNFLHNYFSNSITPILISN